MKDAGAQPRRCGIQIGSLCPIRKDQGLRLRLPRVPRLRIPAALLAEVHAHAREGAPQEVCGLLAGRADATGDRDVVHAFRVPNTHPRPVGEYRLDPAEQLRLTLHVEDDLGLEVIGFYHSHPAGPARLSATDAARASWPGGSYLLVHLAPTEGHLSARWDADKGRFVPEEVLAT
jgi:proteasome lid subunit RPN8/RPN11